MTAASRTCPRCNRPVATDTAFCVHCGNALTPVTTAARYSRGSGRRQCAHCGTALSSFAAVCPGCQQPVEGMSAPPPGVPGTTTLPADFSPPAPAYFAPMPPSAPALATVNHLQCASCGQWVAAGVPLCPHCHAALSLPTRPAYAPPPAPPLNPMYPYYGGGYPMVPYRPRKEKTTAALLSLLLGGFGAQRFYLGQTGLGILSLIFCWTYIPTIVGLVEGIVLLCMDENEFHRRHG